jgi:hypothetical protein
MTRQILFNPTLHQSVGCIIPQALGVADNGRMVVRAGTPLMVNLEDRTIPAVAANPSSNPMTAVLVHDVDVTDGAANGTACIFGFINLARTHASITALVTAALNNPDASKLITFLVEA